MKFRASCFVMILILLFSTFGCVIGSENVTDIDKIYKKNLSLTNSFVKSPNTTNMSTIYVDQTRGNDAYPGTFDNPKRSIKSAINAVKEDGNIKVASGQYSGTDNTNLIINKTIKITGKDNSSTTINGNNNQICSITGNKTVSITGFTFINGKSDQGGAINNLGSLNISSCVFKNNVGSMGGAIYNKNNNLHITNCYFTNNHANQGNGLGGAIYTRQGVCTVTETVFDSNSAAGDAGAINNNYNGSLTIFNCQFNYNTARSAGAISNGQNCDIKSCTFNKNTAESNGRSNILHGQFKH